MTAPSREELAARLADLDLHDELINYEQAAIIAGVSIDAVKQWKSRHDLDPAAWQGRSPLFRPDAVRAADLRARACPAGRPRKDHPRTVSAADDWDTARLARSTKELPEDFFDKPLMHPENGSPQVESQKALGQRELT